MDKAILRMNEARGSKENNCLNRVRECIQKNTVEFYGFDETEKACVINIVNTVFPNQSASKFPDFVGNDGYIEHFQVDPSPIVKKRGVSKGTQNNINKGKAWDQAKRKLAEISEEIKANGEKGGVILGYSTQLQASYENFEKSLNESFSNHIDSSNKYTGNGIGIFLLENSLDCTAKTYITRSDEWREGHLFHLDKNSLEYICKHCNDKIQYIIYCGQCRCEFIKVASIPLFVKDNDICWFYYDQCIIFGAIHAFI